MCRFERCVNSSITFSWHCRLLKIPRIEVVIRYNDDLAKEFQNMAKKITVQMKDHIPFGEVLLLLIVFLQEIKSACNARKTQEDPLICRFMQYLAGPTRIPIKERFPLTTSAKLYHDGALK